MRGRHLTALVATGVLAVAAGGCGGGEEGAPQVPGPPASMPLPPEGSVPPAGEDAGAQDTTDDPAAEDPAADPEAATDDTTPAPPADESGAVAPEAPPETAAAVPEDTGGGAAAPEAAPDGPEDDTAPPEGSEAEEFEDFCEQNPGAC